MSFDPTDPVHSVFAGIIGLPAWQVRKGYASNLMLEFGERRTLVREAVPEAKSLALRRPRSWVRGDWHLWVHSCNWTVTEGDTELANSESDDDGIEAAAQAIEGQRLLDLELDRATTQVRLTFDQRITLSMLAYESESEAFLLYAPDGNVLTWRGDGCYCWSSGNTPPAKMHWRTLPNTGG